MSVPNPDIETLKLTLWIASGVISVLLLVVSFFLKKQIRVSEVLTEAVKNLTTTVAVMQTQNNERNPVIQTRLNDHGRNLDNHETRITKLETRCAINHKKNE